MDAEPMFGGVMSCLEGWDEATTPIAYFIGIVIQRPNGRSKTLWYLFGAGGHLCAAWTTQTLTERLPDFLKPKRHNDN